MFVKLPLVAVVAAALSTVACGAAPSESSTVPVPITTETATGLHVDLVGEDGQTLASLDYRAESDQATFALAEVEGQSIESSKPFAVPALDAGSAGELTLALYDAASHALDPEPTTGPGSQPNELFYAGSPTKSGTTCTPASYCTSFYGGYACFELNGDCSGSTWIIF